MELSEAIKTRRSIRSFEAKPVEDEKVEKILQAGIDAPSAGNLQAHDFYVFKKKENREKLSEIAHGQSFVVEAPVVVVVCANENRSSARYGERGETLYSVQDATIAATHMILVIHDLGLGTCWVGAFDEGALIKEFNLPKGVRPVAIFPIGYPKETPSETSRLPAEELVHYD
jgi:nitroreductase